MQAYWPVVLPLPPSTLNTPSDVTPQFIDYNYKSPYMIQYNVSVQQQLPWDMGISVGYVGNHGVHLATIRESNPIFATSTGPCGDPASLCVNGVVQFWDTGSPNYHPVNPNMPSTINIATVSESRYNALQIVLNKRTTHGLEFQTSFTHSKVQDDTQGQENVRDCHAAAGLQGVDPLHPMQTDYGPSCFNIPNNWEFSVVYHFPTMTGNGFLPKAANGWWVGSIASAQSGVPFSVITADNRSNSGVLQGQNDRVDINTRRIAGSLSLHLTARSASGRQQSVPLLHPGCLQSQHGHHRAISTSGTTRRCSRWRRTFRLLFRVAARQRLVQSASWAIPGATSCTGRTRGIGTFRWLRIRSWDFSEKPAPCNSALNSSTS